MSTPAWTTRRRSPRGRCCRLCNYKGGRQIVTRHADSVGTIHSVVATDVSRACEIHD